MVHVAYTGTREPNAVPKGLEVTHVPALQVETLDDVVARADQAIDPPCTVVVFSRNAVRILADSELADALGGVEAVDWWAVGPKTARSLATRLGLQARYPEGASTDALVSALAEHEIRGPVVKLALEGTERDLSTAFSKDLTVRNVPVYRTVPVVPDELAADLRDASVDWVAVASAKGARAVDAAVDRLESGEDLRWAAIGPSTSEALRDLDRPVDAQPDRPGVQTMLQSIAVLGRET